MMKQRINNWKKNPVIQNVFFLSLVKGGDLILPLITFPYLVRVLGPDYFGLIAFAVAVNAYFIMLTDYGFSLSATRLVSIERSNSCRLAEIFSSVMFLKFSFLLFSLFILVFFVVTVPRINHEYEIFLLSFGAVIGQVLFPVWLFQGLEKMKYITFLNLSSRVLYLILVFSLVRESSDFWLIPTLNGLLSIGVGSIALIFVYKTLGIRFSMPNKESIKMVLIDGWHVFQSKLSINIYTTSTAVILGLLVNNSAVGYYSAGEKLVKAVQSLYAPIGQAVYPYICKLMSESKEKALSFLRMFSLLVGTGMFVVSLSLWLSADWLTLLVLGEEYRPSILVVKVLAWLPFVVALSNIYGIQTLLNMGYKRAFSHVLLIASIAGALLSWPLITYFSFVGSAWVVLVVEVFVTLAMAGCLIYFRIDAFPRFPWIKSSV